MKQLLLSVAVITTLGVSSPAKAQGVPTFDGSQLGQLVAQLEHMAEDLNVQLQQLATMRLELETQLSQLLNLEAQLTSLIEGSGLSGLFASIEEFRALRGKLVAPLNTARALADGDFLSGFNPGAELSASRLLAPFFGTSLPVWSSLIGLILIFTFPQIALWMPQALE